MRKIFKSAASLVTGAALAVSVTAMAELPASAASTCAASFDSYSTIRQGSKGRKAKAVECLLKNAGYSVTVNANVSAHDAQQMARFRSKVGMSPLKAVGPRGWAALLSKGSTPALRSGQKGSDVLRLQRSLRALGWTKITLNGTYSASTVSAVKAAQKVRGQKQTGAATRALWQSLQTGRVATASEAAALARKRAATKASSSSSSKGARALAFAKKQLGDSYRYGATGPNSWDCSGLTGGAWKAAGVKLPRTSQAQYRVGKKISKSALKPGDLVFFYSGISHVGIYAGGGKIIHASRPGKPVQYIKMSYMPFMGARRPA
jgi:cell wall-associated NlpC family hydrolase